MCLDAYNEVVYALDAEFECSKEAQFFFFDDFVNQLFLVDEFLVGMAHEVGEYHGEIAKKRFFEAQRLVAITHSPAQNAANDITCAVVGRQLTIGNREGNGAHVVGNDAQCNIGGFCLFVRHAANLYHVLDERLK